jgi:hypothetical protein
VRLRIEVTTSAVIYGATSEDGLCAMTERACGTVQVRTADCQSGGVRRGHKDIPLLPAVALRTRPRAPEETDTTP